MITNAHQEVGRVPFGMPNSVVKPSVADVLRIGSDRSDRRSKTTIGTVSTEPVGKRLVANAPLFRLLLSTERKRVERSGSSSLLVILRLEDAKCDRDRARVFPPLHRGIFSAIRDTDLVGWYDVAQPALGILFTEIAEPNRVIVSTILNRVREVIATHARVEEPIAVACHALQKGGRSFDSLEYCALAGD
jgi:hypothetical protein